MTRRASLTRRLVSLAMLVPLLLVLHAAAQGQVESRAGEEIFVDGDLDDIAFFAGGDVTLNPKSSDDVVAAGGEIRSQGLKAELLIIAGGDLDLEQIDVRDAFLGGGSVDIGSGSIADDLVIAGGDLRFGEDLSIGGAVYATGGEITSDAAIGGPLRVAAGELTLDGPVAGDADLTAERLVIGPRTIISGDLRYRARDISIDPAAVIQGNTEALEWRDDEWDWEPTPAKAALSGLLAFAVTAGGAWLFAVLVAVVFPALVVRTDDQVRRQPLATLGIGLLVVVLGPALAIAFGLSVVGILSAGVLLLALALLLPVGLAAIAYAIGARMRGGLRRTETAQGPGSRALWTTAGFAAALFVSLLPVIGPLLWLVLAVLGIGAAARGAFTLLAGGPAVSLAD